MKKIVLAYSGGLDTSIILKWLQINYKAEVIAYTSNIGQDLNKKKIIQNAKRLGVKRIIIEDLKNIFVKDYVFPMIRAHAVYEGVYLLGTSIARPLIAKRQIEIAKKFKAFAVSHGATGKGNDQVRFELGYSFFGKKIKVIAPWREWKLQSRSDLIKYAKKYKIPIEEYIDRCERNVKLWKELEPHFPSVQEIYFAGGEPLVMEEHYRILNRLVEMNRAHEVTIKYNTNFTNLQYKKTNVLDLWLLFKKVEVGASLDAYGERAEYIRSGCNWDDIVTVSYTHLRAHET